MLTWSVGFSLARNQRGNDGVNELVEVRELYEVSATPLPANPRTSTAGMKAADVPSLDELRAKLIDQHPRFHFLDRAGFEFAERERSERDADQSVDLEPEMFEQPLHLAVLALA